MAETPQQIVDRVLREHKRYTGDGLPNEPVNAPLPVGDPQSGPYNPKKKDLRLGLKETLHGAAEETARASDEADRAEAAAAIAQQGGSGLAEFETRALAEAWSGIDPMPESIVIRGDASVDDGMGGTFVLGYPSSDIIVAAGESYGRAKDVSTAERLKTDRMVDAPRLVQKLMMEPFFGYPHPVDDDTSIYEGAEKAAQGIATATIGDTEYVWIVQRCVGSNFTVGERCRIVQFELLEDGSVGSHIAFSEELAMGHGGGLAVLLDGSDVTLVSTMTTESGHEGTDAGKGISLIRWRGADTNQSDVTNIQMVGYDGSGHALETFYHLYPTISTDGQYLAVLCSRKPLAGPYNPTVYRAVLVYSLSDVLTAGGDATGVKPLHIWGLTAPRGYDLQVSQGIAMNRDCIAVIWGFTSAFSPKAVQFYTHDGSLLKEIRPSLQVSEYGIDGLLNHPTLGVCNQMEVEGLFFRRENELLTIVIETWVDAGDIVSVDGRNYAVTARSTTRAPYYPGDWAPTTRGATAGEWEPGTYTRPSGANRRSKNVWSIRVPRGDEGERDLFEGMGGPLYNVTQTNLMYNDSPNVEFFHGGQYRVASYSPQYDRYFYGFMYDDNSFKVFDPLGDTRHAHMKSVRRDGRSYAAFGHSSGGAISFYSGDDSSIGAGRVRIANADGGIWQVANGAAPDFMPAASGYNIGRGGARVGTIFLQNAPDVSSDERLKSTLHPLSKPELAAAQDLARAISTYEVLSDPGQKHIGLGAQTVVAVMEKHGLDPLSYHMIQHHSWAEQPEIIDGDGRVEQPYAPSGEAYSLAYEQVLAFIARGQEQRLRNIEQAIEGLPIAE